MKKLLFISNVTNRITNFSLPSILAAQSMGYEVHMASDFTDFTDDPKEYGVTLHQIDLDRNPFRLKNIKAKRQLLTLMQSEGFDAIHCNTNVAGWFGRASGKKAHIRKIIYTAHGFYFYKGGPLLPNLIIKPLEFKMAHSTDTIITMNKEDYDIACRMKLKNNGKVYYVPGVGVDVSALDDVVPDRAALLKEISAENDDFLLISVGRLETFKNNHVIIKALGKLKNPKIHYIICGEGECKNDLVALAEQCGVTDNVHFLGYRSDIPVLLKSVDAFTMSTFREGLPRAIMEAMSARLPCIVSKIRGNVDLIDEKGGYLCEPTDADAFAAAIKDISSSAEKRRSMGDYNREKVNEFDTENVKRLIKQIYEETLG